VSRDGVQRAGVFDRAWHIVTSFAGAGSSSRADPSVAPSPPHPAHERRRLDRALRKARLELVGPVGWASCRLDSFWRFATGPTLACARFSGEGVAFDAAPFARPPVDYKWLLSVEAGMGMASDKARSASNRPGSPSFTGPQRPFSRAPSGSRRFLLSSTTRSTSPSARSCAACRPASPERASYETNLITYNGGFHVVLAALSFLMRAETPAKFSSRLIPRVRLRRAPRSFVRPSPALYAILRTTHHVQLRRGLGFANYFMSVPL